MPRRRDFACSDRSRVFSSISSRRRPLVLILDDLHWADAPTLRLLEFLTQEMTDGRLLVVGTYRDTDVSRRHQLSDTLGALVRVPHAIRLHLSGLDIDDVSDFTTTTAGMKLPPWLTNAIHSQTEGNPLFVREVVRFLEQEGYFNLASSATIPTTIRLPEGIREAIGRRLNLFSATCNDVLATAAVIGHEFRLDVLLRASRPLTEDAVLEALDEALASHIVEETDAGLYQFTHTLLRITLYDELRTGERRRRHNSVGEAFEAVYRHDPTPVLSNLAYHFRAAGLGQAPSTGRSTMRRVPDRTRMPPWPSRTRSISSRTPSTCWIPRMRMIQTFDAASCSRWARRRERPMTREHRRH